MKNIPCKDCPFKRGNEWRGGWVMSKISALEAIEQAGNIFACHMKHPNNNVFSVKPMTDNDCAGFDKMLENMKQPNKHPEIVNNFLETEPANWNLKGWAKQEGRTFKLLEGV